MKTRKLGEIKVSEIGMGCMAFSHGYGQIPAEEYSIEAIRNAQNPNVVPIPGSKNKERIIENLDAAKVELTDAEFASLEESLSRCKVYGHRGFSR